MQTIFRTSLVSLFLALMGCGGAATEPTEGAPEATVGHEAAAATTEGAAAEGTAEAKADATPAPAAEPPAPPKYAAVVMLKVKDLAAFHAEFAKHEPEHQAIGVIASHISEDIKNPKSLTVFQLTNDLEKLKAYLTDPKMKDAFKAATVIGKPQMVFVENTQFALAKDQKAYPHAVVAEKVKDYDAWKTAFDSWGEARTAAGLAGYCIHRDAADPTQVYVMYQAEADATIKSYITSKEYRKAAREAGVKGAAKASYWKDHVAPAAPAEAPAAAPAPEAKK